MQGQEKTEGLMVSVWGLRGITLKHSPVLHWARSRDITGVCGMHQSVCVCMRVKKGIISCRHQPFTVQQRANACTRDTAFLAGGHGGEVDALSVNLQGTRDNGWRRSHSYRSITKGLAISKTPNSSEIEPIELTLFNG